MQTSASKEILNRAASGIHPESARSVDGVSLIQGVAPCALSGAPQLKIAGLLDPVSRGAAKRASTSESFPQDSAQIFSKRGQDRTHRRLWEIPSVIGAGRTNPLGSSFFTIGCNSARKHFLTAGKTLSTGCKSLTFFSHPMPSFQRSKGLSRAVKTTAPFGFRKLSANNKKN